MKLISILKSTVILLLLGSCATNPFTQQKTIALVPNSQLFPMAFQQYDQFLSEHQTIKTGSDAEMISRVGRRIAMAAERYLNANGSVGYLNDYRWDYNLVKDTLVNAWCMPGGKIVFYTGILPIAKSESGIAAIMGHEVAHALANHGQQRMSYAGIQQVGALAVGAATQNKSQEDRDKFMMAYGVGSNVLGILPYSRKHESEADKIGIYLMAIAGYNPELAPELWVRMKQNANGAAPPEFLSTHPSHETRIEQLKSLVQSAKDEAAKFGVTTFRPE
ncbi:MAG: M48 family metallopeptidase [Bacteroidetes bacterium]|nr:M48 family metallopeptidase [Bacteroidota bacterium]MDA0879606.1 M48 family metallopeptidase [Bacteroidota bacterium]MDA1115681.1 M48 family metallopeptidase [Bacteroidota bacterium]